jgi:ribonuclease E
MDQLEYPKGMSLIARTAGIGRSAAELQWDLNYLLKLWEAIDGAAKAGKGAFLIYQESSLVIRAIRDYFHSDIGEILIDTDDIFDQAHQFMNHVMPEMGNRVKRYRDDAALFSRFQIEHQIETAFSRTVNLPSGGAIVIDHTEALVAVDVNSARATRGTDIEETATRTNLEAADEIARQMRLRDLGGLIVVDFIDMEESKNRREVEQRLRDALRNDRARVQFSSISKFGLLELSRQRLRPALSEGSHITCPRCNGTGHIRDTESSALQILRVIQEEALKDNTAAVHVQVPVEVTSFLLNEKRTEITKIEMKQRVTVLLIPNKHLETPNYKLERLRHDDPRLEGFRASYTMIEEPDDEVSISRREKAKPKQEPVIKGVLPDEPAPPRAEQEPGSEGARAGSTRREGRRGGRDAAEQAERLATTSAAAATAPAPKAMPTPRQPEPAPASGGFFGWVKRILGGGAGQESDTSTAARQAPTARGTTAAAAGAAAGAVVAAGVATAKDSREARDGRDGRAERGERGERGENRRGERGERSDRNRRGGRSGREGREGVDSAAREPRGRAEPRQAETADRETPERNERADRPERGERSARRERPPRDEARGGQRRSDRSRPSERADEDGAHEERELLGGAAATGVVAGGQATEAVADVEPRAFADTVPGETLGEQPGSADAASTAATDQDAEAAAGDADREGRRRRRRGGRGRGRSDGSRTDAAEGTSGEQLSLMQGEEAAAPAAEPVAEASLAAAEAVASAAEGSHVTAQPAAIEAQADDVPAPSAAGLEAAAPSTQPDTASASGAATAEVAREAQATQAPAAAVAAMAAYELPLGDLHRIAQDSGLEWINSDADKVAAAQAAIAAEPAPMHVPRERKAMVVLDEGPLVLVETRRDLSQLKLPFDTAEAKAQAATAE